MKVNLLVIAFACAALCIANAQQNETTKQTAASEKDKMMELYMKYATPGQAHKILEPMAGSWDAKTTTWETPDAPPQVSTGTSENTWILGGRYLQQNFQGDFMGMKFEGVGLTGYDNFKKKYVGTWIDNMSTMIMTLTGSIDASGKVFTMNSIVDDIMTGKPSTFRSVVKIVDNNKHIAEMYMPDPKGKEFKTMEIVYTRKQ